MDTFAPSSALAAASSDRSRSVRLLGLLCFAYVALFSAVVVAWLAHRGVPASIWSIGPGVAVPCVAAVLALRSTADSRRYAMHAIAAVLVLPVAMLLWADSFDESPRSGVASQEVTSRNSPSLDVPALFAGASMQQGSEQRVANAPLLQAAAFPDGSELRVTHFGDTGAAARQIEMLSQALQGVAFAQGGRHGVRLTSAGVGSTLILLEQHGSDVLEIRARSVEVGLARLAAQGVLVPPASMSAPAASPTAGGSPEVGNSGESSEQAQWPFFVGASAAHALAFVVLIVWGASVTTRVPASPDVRAIPEATLMPRLRSIADDVPSLHAAQPAAHLLEIACVTNARRTHRITLELDATTSRVRVSEKLAVRADRPASEDEASMRDFADTAIDGTRPNAQRVWSSTWQATMIEPARLAAVPLQLQSTRVQFPAGYLASLDGEGVLTALCAIATRSGWCWQPRLFGKS